MLFLVGFILPFMALADVQTITISADKTAVKINETVSINATSNYVNTVIFSSNPTPNTLLVYKNTVSTNGLIKNTTMPMSNATGAYTLDNSILFSSTVDGTFTVQAYSSDWTIVSNTLTIKVGTGINKTAPGVNVATLTAININPTSESIQVSGLGSNSGYQIQVITNPLVKNVLNTYDQSQNISTDKNVVIFSGLSENTNYVAKLISPKIAANPITAQDLSFTTATSLAPLPTKSTDLTYLPLAPLPGIGDNGVPIDTAQPNAFGDYLNKLILLFIGICAVLSFIMIFAGGIEYMTSELVSGKAAGIEKLTNAVLGLVLALGAFVILNTLNPQLLNISLNNIPKVSITITPYEQSGLDIPGVQKSASNGMWCGIYPDGTNGKNNWPAIAGVAGLPHSADVLKQLPGITVNNNSTFCTWVGQDGCTSLDGLVPKAITGLNKLKNDCANSNANKTCAIQISGGTECWMHGGASGSTTTHKPGDVNGTVDLSYNSGPDLIKYIKSATAVPITWIGGKKYNSYTVNGVVFVDEPETNHYHVKSW